jgi:hypothetical protein
MHMPHAPRSVQASETSRRDGGRGAGLNRRRREILPPRRRCGVHLVFWVRGHLSFLGWSLFIRNDPGSLGRYVAVRSLFLPWGCNCASNALLKCARTKRTGMAEGDSGFACWRHPYFISTSLGCSLAAKTTLGSGWSGRVGNPKTGRC